MDRIGNGKDKGKAKENEDESDVEQAGLALGVKFDRQALISVLPIQEQAKLTVEGAFKDGSPFVTYGFVTTIKPGTAKRGESTKVSHLATGANVAMPAGALTQDTEITVVKVAAAPPAEQAQRDDAAATRQLKTNGAPYQFGPEGTQFALPVSLTLPYDASALSGADPRALKIAYWNPQSSSWEPLESVVDTALRTVTAKTPHFSLYQVVQPQAGGGGAGTGGSSSVASIVPAAGPDPAFRYVDFYLFPNPSRGSQRPTARVQVGLADSVEVHVYDVSGQLVHSGSIASPAIIDDGNGKGPQYTFEYSWDTSGAGSGVYLVAITAKKGGQGDIKRVKKVAVLK